VVVTESINLQTQGNSDIIDITPEVMQKVAASELYSGTVTIFVSGSTAGLTTIEFEPGVLADFTNMWQRIVPRDIKYEHDRAWGDGNGHAHVRASMLGPSLVIPFNNRSLLLGTWQQIILQDFDNRPRSRNIIVQIMGE